jgi:hypothetical protein
MTMPESTGHSLMRLGQACLVAAALIFGLSGCAGWNLRGDGFPNNELSDSVRKARPKGSTNKIQYGSLSEKGRQIERDLNAQ